MDDSFYIECSLPVDITIPEYRKARPIKIGLKHRVILFAIKRSI